MTTEKTVQFGIEQLTNPTPKGLKYALRAFQFLTGVWALIPQDLLGLSDDRYAHINKWLLVGNAVMLFGIKFFGLDFKTER